MNFLIIAVCIAVVFFVAERFHPPQPQPVFRRGIWADLVYAPLNILLRILVNFILASAIARAGVHILPGRFFGVVRGEPAWFQACVLVIVLDFVFYVIHRLKHRWRWWWRLHETHHSSIDLDFLASVRFHPLEKLIDRFIFLLPIMILGPGDAAIAIWSVTDVFFGMFGHANLSWKLGPLKYIFVGPEMHRWHHVKDPLLRECNYGNNLSVFDWIFGTAFVSNEQPGDFGVDDKEYPVTNILAQFVYAFRSPPRSDAERGESSDG
ncbi:MAG: sterol desaturase family protein [Candidatus Hydrogenedentota bacterium]